MTMCEFRIAREIADGAISVWDHKTSEHYGQAQITFDKEEFSWCFVNVIRPKIPNLSATNKVFPSWTCMDMTSGYVSGRLHNLWVKLEFIKTRNYQSYPKVGINFGSRKLPMQ